MSEDDRQYLTFEEAEAMLAEGEEVHTFMQGGIALVGADWPRDQVLELLRTGKPEVAGEQATAMNHGLVAWCEDGKPVFIETREEG